MAMGGDTHATLTATACKKKARSRGYRELRIVHRAAMLYLGRTQAWSWCVCAGVMLLSEADNQPEASLITVCKRFSQSKKETQLPQVQRRRSLRTDLGRRSLHSTNVSTPSIECGRKAQDTYNG